MKQITSSEELGALIHSMRKSQKITQEKLAAYSGVGIRFIKELERGKPTCEIQKVLNVLQMLGLTNPKRENCNGTLRLIPLPFMSEF